MPKEKLKLKYKYIHFDDVSSLYRKKKTETFHCVNNRTGERLATIKWYSPWRQYCSFPSEGYF